MKKGVLVYLICLLVHVCTAQEVAPAAPLVVPDATDTSSFITDLTVTVRENAKVVLNWKQPVEAMFTFATIERSSGGREFEVVAVIKQSDIKPDNEWIDDSPARGRSLYRVRFSGKDGFQQAFSRSREALVAGDISFRFYPNPVDNILIVRSEAITDIQIVDASGKPRMNVNNLQGLQTLNVTTLEKGIYFLRINNHATGLLTQEKLVKN